MRLFHLAISPFRISSLVCQSFSSLLVASIASFISEANALETVAGRSRKSAGKSVSGAALAWVKTVCSFRSSAFASGRLLFRSGFRVRCLLKSQGGCVIFIQPAQPFLQERGRDLFRRQGCSRHELSGVVRPALAAAVTRRAIGELDPPTRHRRPSVAVIGSNSLRRSSVSARAAAESVSTDAADATARRRTWAASSACIRAASDSAIGCPCATHPTRSSRASPIKTSEQVGVQSVNGPPLIASLPSSVDPLAGLVDPGIAGSFPARDWNTPTRTRREGRKVARCP